MLILPIKKKWYEMILSGEKKEEYRKLSPYYKTRFEHLWQGSLIGSDAKRKVIFRNGYSRKSPSFIATVTLDIGTGKTEWGAEKGKNYYILKIYDIEPYKAESEKKEWV
ncbi:MAG: ASCH domain-containing protein [Lachnospiraceae bacterium]|nr:ASCH domain-containing protein [Lachnospiraceae bacterium]